MDSLQGQLLIAAPRLADPNFFHTVILIVQHNEDGALGVILNRPLAASIQQVWQQVSDSVCLIEGFLYQGGPCDGPLMVVHADASDDDSEDTSSLRFTADRDVIERLVSTGDSPTRFFIGYAGWAPGQLEQELETASWLTTAAKPEYVFDEVENLWQKLHREASRSLYSGLIPPEMMPDDPTLN